MSASIEIRATGQDQVERVLAGVLARGGDLMPLFDNIGQSLVTTTISRFEEGVDPEGTPWIPSIRARETGGKTLVHRTHLRDSIVHVPGTDRVEVGTNLRYAGIHQRGGTISGKAGKLKFKLPGNLGFRTMESVKIPARPFLGISADDREEILALAEDHVSGGDPEFEQ